MIYGQSGSQREIFLSATADGYGPGKHAMVGFFESLQIELAGSGIIVTMIFPEWVSTGISSRALTPDGTPLGEIPVHEKMQ